MKIHMRKRTFETIHFDDYLDRINDDFLHISSTDMIILDSEMIFTVSKGGSLEVINAEDNFNIHNCYEDVSRRNGKWS